MAQKKDLTKEIIIKQIATDEDKILGNNVKDEVKTIFDYENEARMYKVTNIKLNNGVNYFNGKVIESFIGSNNKNAREQLLKGEKIVYTKNGNNEVTYKIEVI